MVTVEPTLLVKEMGGQTREVPLAFGLSVGGTKPVLAAKVPPQATAEYIRAVASAGVHLIWAVPADAGPHDDGRAFPAQIMRLSTAGVAIAAAIESVAAAQQSAEYCQAFIVTGRHMQNFALLKALGRLDHAVFLERGPAATIEEWLMSAEYILCGGNRRVVLIAGASRAGDGLGGSILDISGAVAAKGLTHLPILADTAITGLDGAGDVARAALAAGLHGVIIDGCDVSAVRTLAGNLPLGPVRNADLVGLRAQIDEADAALVRALGRRLAVAAAIGEIKQATGMPVHQPDREEAVLDRILATAAGSLEPDLIRAVWGAIFACSRSRQAGLHSLLSR